MQELNICPFCGGDADVVHSYVFGIKHFSPLCCVKKNKGMLQEREKGKQ